MVSRQFDIGVESLRRIFRDESLRFLDVFLTKEELAIEIAQVDGVKIDYVYLTKACQDKVLEEFTANPAGTNEKDLRL